MLDQRPALAEQALYKQSALLSDAIAALQASDEQRPNMYFLGVAGDSSQRVFERELRYVQQLFDEQYGTEGRSLSLVNSKQSVDDFPLATATSIERSLQGIAAKMNPDQDILFLYLSSHGSADYRFLLQPPAINVADLPAQALADMLAKLPLKNKVVVVSACYSGGFIPLLDDGNTLLITSASADKTSFGCSDEADFTYFGRAFFQDALPESGSFELAFDRAAELVSERELEQEYEPSGPQIKTAPAVTAQLQRWRQQLLTERPDASQGPAVVEGGGEQLQPTGEKGIQGTSPASLL